MSAAGSNSTTLPRICPPPFIIESRPNVFNSNCARGCCLPCPSVQFAYPPDTLTLTSLLQKVFLTTGFLGAMLVVITHLFLPSRRKNNGLLIVWNNLGVALYSTAVFFTFPDHNQVQCADSVTEATFSNSNICYIQGSIFIFGVMMAMTFATRCFGNRERGAAQLDGALHFLAVKRAILLTLVQLAAWGLLVATYKTGMSSFDSAHAPNSWSVPWIQCLVAKSPNGPAECLSLASPNMMDLKVLLAMIAMGSLVGLFNVFIFMTQKSVVNEWIRIFSGDKGRRRPSVETLGTATPEPFKKGGFALSDTLRGWRGESPLPSTSPESTLKGQTSVLPLTHTSVSSGGKRRGSREPLVRPRSTSLGSSSTPSFESLLSSPTTPLPTPPSALLSPRPTPSTPLSASSSSTFPRPPISKRKSSLFTSTPPSSSSTTGGNPPNLSFLPPMPSTPTLPALGALKIVVRERSSSMGVLNSSLTGLTGETGRGRSSSMGDLEKPKGVEVEDAGGKIGVEEALRRAMGRRMEEKKKKEEEEKKKEDDGGKGVEVVEM
ncbi:hypothetical protein HDV05_006272 [Chytridiales sp. JEL 0842]|nr:hypothetical protein HDV05_006272 [Chytridiales sp. JEL 0842]